MDTLLSESAKILELLAPLRGAGTRDLPIEALIAAVERVQSSAQALAACALTWRPIGEARLDGTTFLVNDTTPDWPPFVAAHFFQGEHWSGWVYDDAQSADSNPLGPRPTHYFAVPPLDGSQPSAVKIDSRANCRDHVALPEEQPAAALNAVRPGDQ